MTKPYSNSNYFLNQLQTPANGTYQTSYDQTVVGYEATQMARPLNDKSKIKSEFYRPVNTPQQVLSQYVSDAKSPHGKPQHEEKGYNPLKIPADWEKAKIHAMARRVSKEKKKDDNDPTEAQTCECCGYEIDREDIPLSANIMELGFLGPGFPLFYNFIIYCIFILFCQLSIKGGYNMVTNIMSGYCQQVFSEATPDDKQCPNKWIHIVSLANKLNEPELLRYQEDLGLVMVSVVMVVLLFFRASQRKIDIETDADICSPSDYTVCVKNIPRGLGVDYRKELDIIFTDLAAPRFDEKIKITKIVLVHDIEEIIKLEKVLDQTIKHKQNHLHENYCNYQDPRLEEYDKAIEEIEEKIHKIEDDLQRTNDKFTGIAFVSFQTEAMKDAVLEANPWTEYERLSSYWNKGKLPGLTEDTLAWEGQKLFIEEAPEPNDIDWEFIHCQTKDKFKGRMLSNTLTTLFMVIVFVLLYIISFWKAKLTDQANEQAKEGKIAEGALLKVNILSFVVSWTIVLFNKFVIAKVIHYIVDLELISTKTKFNIVYAKKLSVALFLNTAVLSYIIDILILENIIGEGGFIQNESQVFILNALFPPFVWLVDPWTMIKDYTRNQELHDIAQSVVTQAEANFIAETPDYLQSKRYADIMKTMWFTFLYGGAIPLGIFFSMLGLSIYYYVDKYNLLRRRTVKESLGKDLSNEMIELLEYIIILNGFGNLTMALSLFGDCTWQDITIMLGAMVYTQLPMDKISNYIFPQQNIDEVKLYEEAWVDFDTDYDRENPVTRKEALKQWKEAVRKAKQDKHRKIQHNQHKQLEYNEDEEGYRNYFRHQ